MSFLSFSVNGDGFSLLDIAVMTNSQPMARLLLTCGARESSHCEYAVGFIIWVVGSNPIGVRYFLCFLTHDIKHNNVFTLTLRSTYQYITYIEYCNGLICL